MLPTYRRHAMLPRAVASLRAQTMTDWICVLHNDDPADRFPSDLVKQQSDPRFLVIDHPRNFGGTATFNELYRPAAEPFFSLLEDDNWWEPTFLEEMLGVADANPDVAVIWSNMRVWEEQADGGFRDTGRCVAPEASGTPERVPWGDERQIFGALHSQGAAVFRSALQQDLTTPEVPLAAVEMFRERLFRFPLIRVPRPLANFSVTRSTSRSDDRAEWAVVQAMLAASFLKHARYKPARMAELCRGARAARPPTMSSLLSASFLEPACRDIRDHATPADWYRIVRGAVRRPWAMLRVLRARSRHADWWDFLDRNTALRFSEAAQISAIGQAPLDPKG